jgi:ERCC4-type nuclease
VIGVDRRAGSRELIEPLIRAGLPVEETTLAAGDVQILGLGPDETPILVGIEFKKWADLLACMRNGRFAEQLRAMRLAYEVSWLLIEGQIRIDAKGLVAGHTKQGWEAMHGRYSYQEATAWLHTVAAKAGVLLWRTETRTETLAWVRAVYHWWTAKQWADHRSHLDFYIPPASEGEMFEEPTFVQKMAAVLPGVGSGKAIRCAEHFDSPRAMVTADVKEWTKVAGIGKKLALGLVEVCEGKRVR